ncbi:paramyosin-like isoform X2 [Cheilinus undulatus]|uniref:paramyosin-like isoform X2 n=1 Tax=Cheilinus undulatus TaxID=241271 RepID=UPI001BD33409|nr:paramyosin-like isoform X2 [Cheilinus undulatus]
MFRPSCRSSSPFSLTDLDMWDSRSRFMTQTSAWCGMAAVSETGFLSKASSSTCGSAGGFRQTDPGLRKWQSLSHLEPEGATRPFPPSPGAELRAARGERSFRQADAGQWIQDAHERLDTQLRNRTSQLSYMKTAAQLHDMKHQEKETVQFVNSQQKGELHDKVLQLERELLQMRSSFGSGINENLNPASFSRASLSQEDVNTQDSQRFGTELHKLREALREAEARVKTQEEERNQALQKLRTSTETQGTLLKQMDEMNQKLSHMRKSHSEVQEQLSEANNKISQACLEKAILSTQVLKLEDNIKELKNKVGGDLSEKDKLIQEKADLQQRNQILEQQLNQGSAGCEDTRSINNKQDQEEESRHLKEVNEKLINELEMTKEKWMASQSEVETIRAERNVLSKQITDLNEELSQLIREKDTLLSRKNEGVQEELKAMKEKCSQLKEAVEVLESEKLKLQDRCLCLEARVLEKEEKQLLQDEEHQRQDAVRDQIIRELKAVASHWTEKWQKVSLTLQATQEELEGIKNNKLGNGRGCDSLKQVELDARKQELERISNQQLLHRYRGDEAMENQDTEKATDLSESSLFLEPPSDCQTRHNKTLQSNELNTKLEGREEEMREKGGAWKGAETLREVEINEAQLRNTDLKLKVKDENSSVEGRKDKTVCPVNPETEEQRRLVTEQLKCLFKKREAKDELTVHDDNSSGAAQTGASSLQNRPNTSKAMRKTGDWRIWAQGPGLMPVFEEDEESADCSGGEEVKQTDVTAEMFDHTLSAGIINQNVKHESLLPALGSKQSIHSCLQTSENHQTSGTDMSKTSDEIKLQEKRPTALYPDGIFTAELVDICSPDEEEEEGLNK